MHHSSVYANVLFLWYELSRVGTGTIGFYLTKIAELESGNWYSCSTNWSEQHIKTGILMNCRKGPKIGLVLDFSIKINIKAIFSFLAVHTNVLHFLEFLKLNLDIKIE